jgi:hypothetical protein
MSEPIACRLGVDAQVTRRGEAVALMQRSLRGREPIEGGLRLRFSGDSEPELRDLLRREEECCPFFSFSLSEGETGVVLEATAPPEARGLLDELFAAP